MDWLVGIAEIREMLGGVSRQRVDALTRRADFPPPTARLGSGSPDSKRVTRVWLRDDIDAWSKNQETTRPDRRRKANNPASVDSDDDCRYR